VTSLRIVSTLAVMGAMRELAALYEAGSGHGVEADFVGVDGPRRHRVCQNEVVC
jgi:hypothetical protein